MKRAKDFRAAAWEAKRGKWGTLALIWFVYSLINVAYSWIPYAGQILAIILGGPFALGLAIVSLNVIRGKKVDAGQLFEGFKNFVNAMILNILNTVLIFLWTLLLIIPGIIKSLEYRLSYFVLNDNPGMTANDARKRSMELMKGNRWRLFCLEFSFIGWLLLSLLTLGILYYWVSPYMEAALADFYETILAERGESSIYKVEEIPSSESNSAPEVGAEPAVGTEPQIGAEPETTNEPQNGAEPAVGTTPQNSTEPNL